MSTCRCGDPESDHERTGVQRDGRGVELRPCRPACGCEEFRPRPSAGDEAEAYLSGRTPDESAAREGEVA